MVGMRGTKAGCLAGSRHKPSAGAAWRGEQVTLKPSHLQQCPFGEDLECLLAGIS